MGPCVVSHAGTCWHSTHLRQLLTFREICSGFIRGSYTLFADKSLKCHEILWNLVGRFEWRSRTKKCDTESTESKETCQKICTTLSPALCMLIPNTVRCRVICRQSDSYVRVPYTQQIDTWKVNTCHDEFGEGNINIIPHSIIWKQWYSGTISSTSEYLQPCYSPSFPGIFRFHHQKDLNIHQLDQQWFLKPPHLLIPCTLRFNDAIWPHSFWSTLVNLMACHLFCAKPDHETVIAYCKFDPQAHISVEFESNIHKANKTFASRVLQGDDRFAQSSMC